MSAVIETVSPKRSPRVLRRLVWTVLLVFGPILTFFTVFSAIPETKPTPTWTTSSHEPTPRDFCYAMFPVNNAVELCDAPDGKPVGILSRAVVNSQEEIDASGWVAVRDVTATTWVPLPRLAYTPPPDANTDYFAAFKSAYQQRGEGEYRNAKLDLSTDQAGGTIATLRLRQEDHWQDYVYRLAPGPPKPLEMYRVFGLGEALNNLGRFLGAAVAAAAFFALAVVCAIVSSFRGRRCA